MQVAGLKPLDIDFLRKRLTIRETVAEVNGQIHDADVTRTGKSPDRLEARRLRA
jgi:hypothetical protein